jgi:phage shock protein A
MFKTFVTLFRGAAAAAEEEIADHNALLILDQQIRDAAGAVRRGKQALAIAVVKDDRERKRIDILSTRIADLEERAGEALTSGREDLAAEAAEAIAAMENDRAAVVEARASFADEITHLQSTVVDYTRRLADLDRGRQIAKAAEAKPHRGSKGRASADGDRSRQGMMPNATGRASLNQTGMAGPAPGLPFSEPKSPIVASSALDLRPDKHPRFLKRALP